MKEFVCCFQITKMVVFEVEYSTIADNERPHFSTSAGEFIRSKMNYARVGQCQKSVLPENSAARRFYDKWDKSHLHYLNKEQLEELQKDMEELKRLYNYEEIESERFGRHGSGEPNIPFYKIVELSKMPLKKPAALSNDEAQKPEEEDERVL